MQTCSFPNLGRRIDSWLLTRILIKNIVSLRETGRRARPERPFDYPHLLPPLRHFRIAMSSAGCIFERNLRQSTPHWSITRQLVRGRSPPELHGYSEKVGRSIVGTSCSHSG